MDSAAQPLDGLHTFRNSLYRCFGPRADAHFELADALHTAGAVPSPVHLSLAPVHRRGWGSLYAQGVDEAHVGEILDVFGVNGRSRGPVVTVVVSEAAQLGTDIPTRTPQDRRAQRCQDTH